MTTKAGELSNVLERTVGNYLVLAGPTVHGNMKQVGGSVSQKLNGLAAPISIYIYSTAGSKAPSNTLYCLWC